LQPASSHCPLVAQFRLFFETREPVGVSNLQSLSAEEIGNTLKTSSEATTIAFTNHDRLLQHILVTLMAILAALRFLIFDRCVAFGQTVTGHL